MQHTRESRLAWTTTVEPESCYMVKVFSYLMNQDFQSIGPIGDNIVHLYHIKNKYSLEILKSRTLTGGYVDMSTFGGLSLL